MHDVEPDDATVRQQRAQQESHRRERAVERRADPHAAVDVAGEDDRHAPRVLARGGGELAGHGRVADLSRPRLARERDQAHVRAPRDERLRALDQRDHRDARAPVADRRAPHAVGEQPGTRLPARRRVHERVERGRRVVGQLEAERHGAPGSRRVADDVADERRRLRRPVQLAEQRDRSGREQRIDAGDGRARRERAARRRGGAARDDRHREAGDRRSKDPRAHRTTMRVNGET
jgi:hypothetical protein